jgi:hypothetical protein
MSDEMPEIDEAFDDDAWEYLYLNHPKIADSILTLVTRGASPDRIKRHIIRKYGESRKDIARRCEAAARHLESTKKL